MALPAPPPENDLDAPVEGTSLEGLWKQWDNDETIRRFALKTGTLLSWPSPKHTGVLNFETMGRNVRVLSYLMEIWCPQVPTAKTINIDQIRAEVRMHRSNQGWDDDEDPAIQSLYDIMMQHWPVVKKARTQSQESVPDADGNDLPGEPVCLSDDYGESVLAESLGVVPMAYPVEPMPDSQIPPDTFTANDDARSSGEIALEMEYADSQVPDTLNHPDPAPVADTLIDSQPMSTGESCSPAITPTEMEVTPKASDVVEVVDSPDPPITTTVTNPLPSASKYSPEDLATLQEKIKMIKKRLEHQQVKSSARPLQAPRVATDAQETQPIEMSAVAKTWMENPPAEIPVDPSTPKRFGRVPTQVEASLGSVPEPSVAEPSVPEPSRPKPPLEKSGSVEVVDVEGGTDNTAKDVGEGDQKTGDEDLFHATEVVTRKDQFDERDALNAEAKKRSKKADGEDSEDGEGDDEKPKPKARSKRAKATQAREKQRAAREKAKAKKAAKALKDKEKKKAAAEKKKAAKAEKAAKAKAKAQAKKEKAAGSKRRKNKEPKDEESEPLAESHGEVPVPAMPEQTRADDQRAVEAPAMPSEVSGDQEVASNQAVHGGDGDDGAGGEAGERKSFARRYRPGRSDPAARFDAIKDMFNQHLKHLLNKVSSMEAQ
eukprot:s275_g36.t1